jgi:uroporphyrinogen III methyltransferase / synthase
VTVYLVGAGPGDPGLITRKGADLLARADVVVYDRLVDPTLLLLAPPGAVLLDVGKVPADGPGETGGAVGPGAARQDEINRLLVDHARAGRTVVRLKGGDPFVFGRGGEEVEALRDAGVEWEVVPGVTSAVAVPAYAGVPVTHRGLSTSVTVVTGHVGDPSAPGGVDWDALGRAGGTLVVLMGMSTRGEIAHRLLDAGRPATTPVVVVEWGTTPGQRTERTTLDRLAEVRLGSPAVMVIGPVAGLDLSWREGRPLDGVSVVVTRPKEQATPLTAALSAAGARVIGLPVIEIAGPEDGGAGVGAALASLDRYGWVAFTSANAVHRVVPVARDARTFAGVGLAAVGPGTAAALASYHLVADLVPDRSSGRALAEAFPVAGAETGAESGAGGHGAGGHGAGGHGAGGHGAGGHGAGGRVLFPCAEGARETLPAGLRAKGWDVDEVIAYRTVAAGPPPDAVLGELAGATAVTFGSPSAVRAYLSLCTHGGTPLPVPPVVACVGPVTAAAARAAGLEVKVEPAAPSPDALVAALAAHLASRAPS